MRVTVRPLLVVVLAVLGLLALPGVAMAQQAPEDVKVILATRTLEVAQPVEKADLTMRVQNVSTSRRVVAFEFTRVPPGWEVSVWDRFFDFRLRQVAVESATEEEFRVRIQWGKTVAPGTYTLHMRVISADGAVTFDQFDLTVVIRAGQPVVDAGITVTAQFPVLSGPPTGKFEYEIAIINSTGEETTVDLTGDPPPGWGVAFTPSFEPDKIINSTSLLKEATQRVKVSITPLRLIEAANYPVPINVSDAKHKAAVTLAVRITGRGELAATTTTGLLSLDAVAGQEAIASMRVLNLGSAELEEVTILADPPSTDWKVEPKTKSLASIAPGGAGFDVQVGITPPKNAIPGDYLVTLRANHPDTNARVELRVTVTQSTIWGWLGIVLVVLVLGGLGGLFLRLGRR